MSRSGERGQSAPIGVVLLLGLTILGTTAVVALGGAALTDTQGQSELARSEQAMTLFDSQAAQVALGSSSLQTVDLGQGEGTYSVNPNAGEISIVQLDCDDDGTNNDGDNVAGGSDGAALTTDDDAYILEPTPLGSVTYQTDRGSLAYQGGGVWQQSRSGGVGMVSPPEFHYRGATLTFPVVLTRGGGGASGSATATVTSPAEPAPVFADASESFPTRCGGNSFENPITDGTVIVRIESEYAKGWGEYFETRTDGSITYPDDDVVIIELISLGNIGDFSMPGEGGSVPISGATGDHATSEYKIRLRPDDTDAATFNNLQWSMYVEEGNQQMEIHVRKSGSEGCDSGTIGSTGITADVTVYYSADGGSNYQGWRKTGAYEAECDDLNGDGDDEIYMDIGFIDDDDNDGDYDDVETGDPGDPVLTYTSLSSTNLLYFNPNGNFDSTTTFGGHVTWESKTYDSSVPDTESIDRIINHYFAELPAEFDLTVDDQNSDSISEAGSSGRIVTGGSGRYVTYLHVTENEIQVEIES